MNSLRARPRLVAVTALFAVFLIPNMSRAQEINWGAVYQGMYGPNGFMNQQQAPKPKPKQVDLKCAQDCRSNGYSWDLCDSKCSY